MNVKLKRAYEPVDKKKDGKRILVDRLWPRGLTKAKAGIDLWLKEIAPSHELRQWFAHDPEKWAEFQRRYRAELKANPEPLATLRKAASRGPITLIYAAKDETHNEAALLQAMLSRKPARRKKASAKRVKKA